MKIQRCTCDRKINNLFRESNKKFDRMKKEKPSHKIKDILAV